MTGAARHLWFVGDPSEPGVERRGRLTLHRWCQWISQYAPLGVYQKEDDKERDLAASLPPFLLRELLVRVIAAREDVTMLREVMQVVGTPAPVGAVR